MSKIQAKLYKTRVSNSNRKVIDSEIIYPMAIDMVKLKINNENPRDRFRRLATNRTKKVIEAVRILGHCSNSSLYEYDENDVKKIFSAIEKEIRHVKTKFQKLQKVDLEL